MSAEQIAQRRQIPVAYTQKILQRLTTAGMVESLKGVGYRLSLPLDQITAYHLIQTLSDPEVNPQDCGESGLHRQFEQRVGKALKSFNLSELKN